MLVLCVHVHLVHGSISSRFTPKKGTWNFSTFDLKFSLSAVQFQRYNLRINRWWQTELGMSSFLLEAKRCAQPSCRSSHCFQGGRAHERRRLHYMPNSSHQTNREDPLRWLIHQVRYTGYSRSLSIFASNHSNFTQVVLPSMWMELGRRE